MPRVQSSVPAKSRVPPGIAGVDLERLLRRVGQGPLLVDRGVGLAGKGADDLEIGGQEQGGHGAAEHPGAVPGHVVDDLVIGGSEAGAKPGQGALVPEAGLSGGRDPGPGAGLLYPGFRRASR